MKRNVLILSACVAAMAFASSLFAQQQMDQRHMRVNLWGSGLTAVNGNFSAQLKSKDYLNTGTSFGFDYQYFPARNFAIQAGYQFGRLQFDKQYRSAGKTPNFVLHQITIAGVYRLSDLTGRNAAIRPFVSGGIGLYPFRVTQDGAGGDVVRLENGNKFQKTSFGLNGSLGLEWAASHQIAISGGARYNYVFSKDEKKFGPDFNNQGLLNFGVGLSYNITGR